MLDDVLCLVHRDEKFHLVSYDNVSSSPDPLNPPMFFYNPNNPSHLEIAKNHTKKGTFIIALTAQDDPTTPLPDNTFAVIYCNNPNTTTQTICKIINDESAGMDFVDFSRFLKGQTYHHQFTANGDGAIDLIAEQVKTQITHTKTSESIFCIAYDNMDEVPLNHIRLLGEILSPFWNTSDPDANRFWCFHQDKEQTDTLIVDVFYRIA